MNKQLIFGGIGGLIIGYILWYKKCPECGTQPPVPTLILPSTYLPTPPPPTTAPPTTIAPPPPPTTAAIIGDKSMPHAIMFSGSDGMHSFKQKYVYKPR